MRANEFISEDVGPNLLYHGVPNGNVVTRILKSGIIKVNEPFELDAESEKEAGIESLPRISLTRDQYLHFPYGGGVAQFVINRDALKQYGYKIRPTVSAGMPGKYEKEEQVYKNIPLRSPFVVELQYDPDIKIPKTLLARAKELGIKLSPWRKEAIQYVSDEPKPTKNKYDPSKLSARGNSYTSYDPITGGIVRSPATEWYVGYESKDGSVYLITQPSKDKEFVEKLALAVKDRMAKGLSWEDLLPQDKYAKSWGKGTYKLQHGTPEYDKA